jgi:hypothetical protein
MAVGFSIHGMLSISRVVAGGGIEPPIQFQAFQSDKHIDFIHL